MKSIIFTSIAVLILFAACKKDSDSRGGTYLNKITLKKADKLVTDWVFKAIPNTNPSFALNNVVEYTTNDISSKFGGQVFSVRSNVPELMDRWFFIKKDKVYDLHGYHYFNGIQIPQYALEKDRKKMLVTDLDNDRKYELIYIGNWGSYYMRETLNCFYTCTDGTYKGVGKDISVSSDYDFDLYLKQKSYQDVYLCYVDEDLGSVEIGEINIVNKDAQKQLKVELYNNCPQKIKDKILL